MSIKTIVFRIKEIKTNVIDISEDPYYFILRVTDEVKEYIKTSQIAFFVANKTQPLVDYLYVNNRSFGKLSGYSEEWEKLLGYNEHGPNDLVVLDDGSILPKYIETFREIDFPRLVIDNMMMFFETEDGNETEQIQYEPFLNER